MTHRVHHTRTCATEGCTRLLKARWPHDTCPACRDEVTPSAEAVARPGTRVARVPYATSHSGVHLSAPVTLPAEPWSS